MVVSCSEQMSCRPALPLGITNSDKMVDLNEQQLQVPQVHQWWCWRHAWQVRQDGRLKRATTTGTSGASMVVLTTCITGMSSSGSSSATCLRRLPDFDVRCLAAFLLRRLCLSSSCSFAIFMYVSDDGRPTHNMEQFHRQLSNSQLVDLGQSLPADCHKKGKKVNSYSTCPVLCLSLSVKCSDTARV